MQLDLKYEKLTAQAHGEKELLKELEEQKWIEILNISEKYLQKNLDQLEGAFEEEGEAWDVKNNKIVKNQIKADTSLNTAKIDMLGAGLDAVKSNISQESNLYKILFAAQKANAIANILIRLQGEVAGIAMANAPLGVPGIALTAAQSIAAKIRAGIGIGVIAAQTAVGFKGFAEGGYTGLGYGQPDSTGYKPAGVVHENEYVVPEWMMNQPYVANTVGILEDIRSGKQFAQGGFTENNTIENVTNNTTTISQTEVVELLKILVVNSNTPAIALYDDAGILKHREKLRDLEKIEEQSKISV